MLRLEQPISSFLTILRLFCGTPPGALLTWSPDDPDTWSTGLLWIEAFAGDLLVGERALLTPLIGDGLACANLQEVKIKAATNTFTA